MTTPSVADLAGRTTQAAIPSATLHADRATTRRPCLAAPLDRARVGRLHRSLTGGAGIHRSDDVSKRPHEPSQQFKAGLTSDYAMGVDEQWKDKCGVWIVRTSEDLVQEVSGFYVLIAVCTHLGCTPNYLPAEQKFKCPCHGSGFRLTGINFEGPAPRPLERAAISLADDGQMLIDKSRRFQFELGQWGDPESFLKA